MPATTPSRFRTGDVSVYHRISLLVNHFKLFPTDEQRKDSTFKVCYHGRETSLATGLAG